MPAPRLTFKQQASVVINSRPALYINEQSYSEWSLPIAVSAPVSPARLSGKVSELCESLFGRQTPPLGGTSAQLFPSLGMGFLEQFLGTTASVI